MNDKIKNELQISVAGIRGIYPEYLTSEIVFNFGIIFGSFIKANEVFICSDTRISGQSLKDSAITGLLCSGKDVIDIGIAATPEIGYIIEKARREASAGIVITASHNPAEYNGIKFFSEKGTFLNAEEMGRMLDMYYKRAAVVSQEPGLLSFDDYTERYFNCIYNTVNIDAIRKKKFKVVVDVCQGVGALKTEEFLGEMGCEVVLINRDPLGVFSHNPEPLPENLKEISERVVKERADIGFAQDPDCDRLALICENGAIPGEEAVVVLAVRNILEYHKKGNVVVNLSTTMLVEDVAKSLGALVYRAKIGEVNVVEKMKETGAVIGGEGNGGVIFPEAHYGRDSFVGMALILEYLALRDTSISVVVNEMPKYFILKEKITVSDKHKADEILNTLEKTLKEKEQMNTEDGIKIIRADGWIHIRPSGTEPVIRVYAEAKSKDIARQYLSEFISLISS